jgi:hypothetical protein
MFEDVRGVLHSIKCPFPPKEILVSENVKNAFRGMHQSPYGKFIYVSKGKIRDFIWEGILRDVTLTKGQTVYVPPGAAHGFLSVESSEIIYLLEDYFDPEKERNIFWQTPEYGIPKFPDVIMSEKDKNADFDQTYDYLVLGSSGFLGQNCMKYLNDKKVLGCNLRLSDHEGLRNIIKKSKVKYVICAAGIGGRPTVEWCETNEHETYMVNFLEVLNLMEICKDVHLTIFGSGYVYKGEKRLYTEEDPPDMFDKVYPKLRGLLERHVKRPNVLYLRIAFPCSFDGHPKCFITKMRNRTGNVHNATVPITPISDLFQYIPTLVEKNIFGILNFVSEGGVPLHVLAGTPGPTSDEVPLLNYELSTAKLSKFIPVKKTADILSIRCA